MRDISSKKADAMASLDLPEWLERPCPHCEGHLPIVSIIGLGVELSPKLFGNVSVNYVCPHCYSLIENHYVAAMTESLDVESFFASSKEPSEPVMLSDIMSSPGGNLSV